MTPIVSTEIISSVQNEPPRETVTVTDMNTVVVYPMDDRVNRFIGNNGHPNANVCIVPSQRKHNSEGLVCLGARLGPLERMDDFPIASGQLESTDLPQTLVVVAAGGARKKYQLSNFSQREQFGYVFRAFDLNTSRMVTVKRIKLKGLEKKEVARRLLEIDILKQLSHPSIIKYEAMVQDENTLNTVFEYAENGSLGQTLKEFGKLEEKLVASYVTKILSGLDYIHRNGVVHCDIRADNILTTGDGRVKLSEFGTSFRLREVDQTSPVVGGSPNWMAPEVIELKGISTKSDIWSLGCTVSELLTGRPPYADIQNIMAVMFRIVEDDPPIPGSFGDPLVAFLKECFHKDPAQRPSAENLLRHEWFKQHLSLDKDLPADCIYCGCDESAIRGEKEGQEKGESKKERMRTRPALNERLKLLIVR